MVIGLEEIKNHNYLWWLYFEKDLTFNVCPVIVIGAYEEK